MNTNSAAAATSGEAVPGRIFQLGKLPWRSWILLLGSGVLALSPLTATWNGNPNYSFGWWIPVVCMVLFSERWPMRPTREVAGAFPLFPRLLFFGLIFLAFRLVGETDPSWRPGLWVLVTLYILVLVTWLWLEGGLAWVWQFAFPVGFLFLCVPWPFGIEYPLTQDLMRWNAILVAHSLQGIGISADPAGNIIQLQNCQLGVEEACSGILSLQASLVMGCLLGDIYRLSIRRRLLLVLSSMLLALVGNYFRTFFLALMAFYSGPDAVPRWHDTAGYAILVFTALGSWLAALGFADKNSSAIPVGDVPVNDNSLERKSSLRFAIAIFCIVLLAEAITQAWFGWRESKLVQHPKWGVQMPTSAPTYKPVTIPEVTLEALQCDKSLAGQWTDALGWSWNVYWFQYDPKPYNRIVVSWHIPDKCLPSIGLVKDRDYPDFGTSVNGIDLYVHPKRFVSKDVVVYLFWIVYANQGDLPSGNYDTKVSTSSKINGHLIDIWKGYRGMGVETLEVAIGGPKDYEDAKAKFSTELKSIILPGKFVEATSH